MVDASSRGHTPTEALSPTPAGKQTGSIVFHNANIHIGNGELLENATIAFEGGKITRMGYFKMAWQESDIDLKGKHIYPGFILPNSNLGLTEVDSVKDITFCRNPSHKSLMEPDSTLK